MFFFLSSCLPVRKSPDSKGESMSNVALMRPRIEEAREYLGPAVVTEVAADDVVCELPPGPAVRARLALAFPYRPAPGDTLLVIGRGGAHYVIGVLSGSGQTVLAFQGG